MNSRVTLVIILISITLLTLLATTGLQIGNFRILSVSQVVEENYKLNQKIDEASILTSKTFPEKVKEFEETYEEFMIQRQKYNDLRTTTEESDKEIFETKQYDIAYLWKILGNYATKRNVSLGIDVQKSNMGDESIYNINYTVKGRYVNISQFLVDLENDSDLYFRIYNFKVISVNDENGKGLDTSGKVLKATFSTKNINLNPTTIS